jgi:hypothetical protein
MTWPFIFLVSYLKDIAGLRLGSFRFFDLTDAIEFGIMGESNCSKAPRQTKTVGSQCKAPIDQKRGPHLRGDNGQRLPMKHLPDRVCLVLADGDSCRY